jgi:hypothetical protein
MSQDAQYGLLISPSPLLPFSSSPHHYFIIYFVIFVANF